MATVEQTLKANIPDPAFALQPSRAAPIKSGMIHSSRGTAARAIGPITGKYSKRGSGGGPITATQNQDLFVGGQETELGDNTTEVDQWGDQFGGSTITNTGPSKVIKGGTQGDVNDAGSNGGSAFVLTSVGGGFDTSSASAPERIGGIFTFKDSESVALTIESYDGNTVVAGVRFNPKTGEKIEELTGVAESNISYTGVHDITPLLATDKTTVFVEVHYSFDKGASSLDSGPYLALAPGWGDAGKSVTAHYMGYRHGPEFQQPIRVSGDQGSGPYKDRGSDEFIIDNPGDFWNPNEGTWFMEAIPIGFKFNRLLEARSSSGGNVNYFIAAGNNVMQHRDSDASTNNINLPYVRERGVMKRFMCGFDETGTYLAASGGEASNGSGGYRLSSTGAGASNTLAEPDKVIIGKTNNSGVIVRSLRYYPKKLEGVERDVLMKA